MDKNIEAELDKQKIEEQKKRKNRCVKQIKKRKINRKWKINC